MMDKVLLEKLNKVEEIQEDKIYVSELEDAKFSILKVRDYMMTYGAIVEEDLDKQIYIAYFKVGTFNPKRILVGTILKENKLTVVGYSGNSAKKVVDELIQHLSAKKNPKNPKKKPFILTLCLVVALSGVCSYFIVSPAIEATKDYNVAVEFFNEKVEVYNDLVSKVSIDNIEGVPGETPTLSIEKTDFFAVVSSVLKGNTASKIKNDEATIYEMADILQDNEKILERINNPSNKYVESCLKNIEEIDKIKSVTKDNDPNGFLGKEHGYTSCVYFTIDGLELDGVKSTDPVVRGTNGGGCVEVYQSLQDAIDRCDYLKQFDNTILYSGSYAIVGTMVIRTSYVLINEQQYTLTDYIVKEFTK